MWMTNRNAGRWSNRSEHTGCIRQSVIPGLHLWSKVPRIWNIAWFLRRSKRRNPICTWSILSLPFLISRSPRESTVSVWGGTQLPSVSLNGQKNNWSNETNGPTICFALFWSVKDPCACVWASLRFFLAKDQSSLRRMKWRSSLHDTRQFLSLSSNVIRSSSSVVRARKSSWKERQASPVVSRWSSPQTERRTSSSGKYKLCLISSVQGPQWWTMERQLSFSEQKLRQWIEKVHEEFLRTIFANLSRTQPKVFQPCLNISNAFQIREELLQSLIGNSSWPVCLPRWVWVEEWEKCHLLRHRDALSDPRGDDRIELSVHLVLSPGTPEDVRRFAWSHSMAPFARERDGSVLSTRPRRFSSKEETVAVSNENEPDDIGHF